MKLLDFIQHIKPSYEPDWYHHAIIEELESVAAGQSDLLVSAPPGHGKTELVSILFPAWLVAEDPQTHIISLANSDGLSRMSAGNILRLIQSPQFQEIQPVELDKATEQTFLVSGNDGRPTLHAAGINGQLTGHRAKFLIFDDLIKSLSEAYSEVVRERVWSNFNSAAETRLLPDGRIVGIHTRWHLDDPIGRLVKRAMDSEHSRQFVYLNLAGTNSGSKSYRVDTRSKSKTFFPSYQSLATKLGQPYSFSPGALRGKEADLGPTVYSALYDGNPVAAADQMFPPECWGFVDRLILEEYSLIVSAWDTAARDKTTNDPSANVVIGRRHKGDWVVLDAQEFRLTFDKLLPVVLERDRSLAEQMKQIPLLCIEDKSSGQQLLDVIRSQFPTIPVVGAIPTTSKIIRAEGVTPFTTARSVSLLRGDWNAQFIADMANFPASDRDHYTDAFGMGMKVFTSTGREFRKSEWVLADRSQEERKQLEEALTEQSYEDEYGGLTF
jgi:predicted phage terminase large subunit-like protein